MSSDWLTGFDDAFDMRKLLLFSLTDFKCKQCEWFNMAAVFRASEVQLILIY